MNFKKQKRSLHDCRITKSLLKCVEPAAMMKLRDLKPSLHESWHFSSSTKIMRNHAARPRNFFFPQSKHKKLPTKNPDFSITLASQNFSWLQCARISCGPLISTCFLMQNFQPSSPPRPLRRKDNASFFFQISRGAPELTQITPRGNMKKKGGGVCSERMGESGFLNISLYRPACFLSQRCAALGAIISQTHAHRIMTSPIMTVQRIFIWSSIAYSLCVWCAIASFLVPSWLVIQKYHDFLLLQAISRIKKKKAHAKESPYLTCPSRFCPSCKRRKKHVGLGRK